MWKVLCCDQKLQGWYYYVATLVYEEAMQAVQQFSRDRKLGLVILRLEWSSYEAFREKEKKYEYTKLIFS